MQELCEEHEKMRMIVARFQTVIQLPAPSDDPGFPQLRLTLSKALNAHFAQEDRALGKIMWGAAGMPTDLLNGWAARRQEFRTNYSQHLRDWPLSEALRDWAAYGKAVRQLAEAGEALMVIEEQQIYPLAESQ